MADIRSVYKGFQEGIDYALSGLGLEDDDGLESMVVISLFTDRRARDDDALPDGSGDRRGWWGDTFTGARIGSRLWLLNREKQTHETLRRAKDYAAEALEWILEAGFCNRIEVDTSFPKRGVIGLRVTITKTGEKQVAYEYLFDAQLKG